VDHAGADRIYNSKPSGPPTDVNRAAPTLVPELTRSAQIKLNGLAPKVKDLLYSFG
jgi:hypothetical protein